MQTIGIPISSCPDTSQGACLTLNHVDPHQLLRDSKVESLLKLDSLESLSDAEAFLYKLQKISDLMTPSIAKDSLDTNLLRCCFSARSYEADIRRLCGSELYKQFCLQAEAGSFSLSRSSDDVYEKCVEMMPNGLRSLVTDARPHGFSCDCSRIGFFAL